MRRFKVREDERKPEPRRVPEFGRSFWNLKPGQLPCSLLQGEASLSDFLISQNIRPEGYPGWGEIMDGAGCLHDLPTLISAELFSSYDPDLSIKTQATVSSRHHH